MIVLQSINHFKPHIQVINMSLEILIGLPRADPKIMNLNLITSVMIVIAFTNFSCTSITKNLYASREKELTTSYSKE
jgi:hypothetical protein